MKTATWKTVVPRAHAGRITTGMAARIAGMGRVAFFFALERFKVSPIGTPPEELAQDARDA